MKKLFLLVAALFGALVGNAQNFSGKIEFRYGTQKDTSTNIYQVKDQLIRLDQFKRKTRAVEGSFLIDLEKNEIKFMSPGRKVWGIQKIETPSPIKGQCVVTKGGVKTIAGARCTEYAVKNFIENTIITYWI